jgi:hypothetical protein
MYLCCVAGRPGIHCRPTRVPILEGLLDDARIVYKADDAMASSRAWDESMILRDTPGE